MYSAFSIDNRAPEALFTRGVRGYAPPENFVNFRSSEMAFP